MDFRLKNRIENIIIEGELFDEPWDCDILSILTDQINAHNTFRKGQNLELEPKFLEIEQGVSRLSNLLWSDFEYLKQGVPSLKNIEKHLHFLEIFGPNPNAQTFWMENKLFILFRTPLLYFMHSFYSKALILMADNLSADCLPEHNMIMSSDTYSDVSLFAGIFNDLEIFYHKNAITQPFEPQHLASPYLLCGAVAGTRRFILAHELAHSFVDLDLAKELAPDIANFYNIEPERARKWAIEHLCDYLALSMILNIYNENSLYGPSLYELEDTLSGILLFFYMLDLVEVSFDDYYSHGMVPNRNPNTTISHPPAWDRAARIKHAITSSDLYQNNANLKSTIDKVSIRYNSFRMFLGGLNAPLPWVMMVRGKLTPFGSLIYRRIFYALTCDPTINAIY